MRALLIISLVSAVALGQLANQSSLRGVAEKVDRYYNALRTLKCDFTEQYQGNGTERSESGTLLLKKPGRMRWDYTQPQQKLFLTDGRTAWFYVPADRQARKSPAKDLDDLRSPLRYLLGKTKLEKELDQLTFAPDVSPVEPGDAVLRGRPKNMSGVEDVLLEATPAGQIRRLIIHESDGSTTEFTFTNIKENVSIPDSTFHFSPPAGVEVITSKDIAGAR